MISTIILAIALLLAGAAPAHAVVETALFLSTLLPGTFVSVGFVETVLTTAALAAASYGVQALTADKQTASVDSTSVKNVFETDQSPEYRGVGRALVGGAKAFGGTAGLNRWRLHLFCRGPVDGPEAYYLGQNEVTVEYNGEVSSPPWPYVNGSYCKILTKLGADPDASIAWPELISQFPDLWTSAHIVKGIAQGLVQYVNPGYNDEKYAKLYYGDFPDLSILWRLECPYDPRDPGQNIADLKTWQWTDNGILCCLHVLMSFPEMSWSMIDLEDIAEQADKADAMVPTLTGTEKRSRVGGIWSSETQRATVLQEWLDSAGAELVMRPDNRLSIRLIETERSAEITIPDRHIVDLKLQAGPENVERPNRLVLSYYSPERKYQVTEIDLTGKSWAIAHDEIDRVGPKDYKLELKYCQSASQAQRIGRMKYELARADRGICTANMYGVAAWGCTTIGVEMSDLDETPVCVIDAPRINDDSGTVEIPFAVWPTFGSWVPATMEAPAPSVTPDVDWPSALDTPPTPTNAGQNADLVQVNYSLPSGGTISETVYRVIVGDEYGPWMSMAETDGTATATASLLGAHAQFRTRCFNDDGEASNWSDILDVASLPTI